MITLTIALLAAWLTMLIAPETPIGCFLHRALVEMPAARLSRITRGQILLTLLLITMIGGLVWLIGRESVGLMSMSAPEITSGIMTFEVTTWLDVVTAAVMVASATRLRGIGRQVRAMLTRRPQAPRARKTRRPSRATPANDDEHRRAVPLAA